MRLAWSALLGLLLGSLVTACGFDGASNSSSGDAGDDAPSGNPDAASDLRWDTTDPAVPVARWTPSTAAAAQDIQLFSDPACTTPHGPAITLDAATAAHPLPETVGGVMTFSISTRTVDNTTLASGCSNDVGTCPTRYLHVPDTRGYTPAPFCIAKYEMRQVDGIAQPIRATTPWASLTLADAKQACLARGAGYHLVTNPEWMAVARDLEATPSNWSATATPFLNKGKTNDCAIVFGASGPDDDPCFETKGPACADRGSADFLFKRTHQLSTGEPIWDLSGNMFELLDHPSTTNIVDGMWPGEDINTTSNTAFVPLLQDDDYKSANRTHNDDAHKIGLLYVVANGYVFTRGGDFCGFSGIYAVALLHSDVLHNNGFRCVYTP